VDDEASLILSVLFFAMAAFTVGAGLGWRWEARGERAKFEPGWIFVMLELTWLAGIALMFLNRGGWLTAVTFALWAVALLLRVRARLSRRREAT
jgi:hypothetical protein